MTQVFSRHSRLAAAGQTDAWNGAARSPGSEYWRYSGGVIAALLSCRIGWGNEPGVFAIRARIFGTRGWTRGIHWSRRATRLAEQTRDGVDRYYGSMRLNGNRRGGAPRNPPGRRRQMPGCSVPDAQFRKSGK